MSVTSTRVGAWFPALAGVVLVAVHVHHVLEGTLEMGAVAEAAPPLLASVGLVGGGVWFVRQSPEFHDVFRVWQWLVAGALGAVVVGLWTSGHFVFGGGPTSHLPYVISGNVTVGLLGGLVLGQYDIRARRRKRKLELTRAQTRAERDRFAVLFENVLNPVVYYEFEAGVPVFRDVNGAFEETFGFSKSEVDGRPIDEVIVPPDRGDEATDINARIRDGETIQRELSRRTIRGVRDFLVSVVPIKEDHESGFFIAIDITEQKRRDRRLQVLNRVLRHDLRNAMNVILGYMDLLGSSPESTERAAEVIQRRAEEMVSLSEKARMIEEALNVGEEELGTTNVASLVRRRLSSMRTDHPDLETSTAFPEQAFARVRDPDLLAAAVDNVVENAVVHADRPDPHLDVSIDVDEYVSIRFADNGPGIPEQELSVLESDNETQLEHLSGLGLWLVDWVLENTDGEVVFESTDSGSTVTFRLPRVEAPESVADEEVDDASEQSDKTTES